MHVSDLVLVAAARGRSRRRCGSVLHTPGGCVSPEASSPLLAPSRGWCDPDRAGRHPIITIEPRAELTVCQALPAPRSCFPRRRRLLWRRAPASAPPPQPRPGRGPLTEQEPAEAGCGSWRDFPVIQSDGLESRKHRVPQQSRENAHAAGRKRALTLSKGEKASVFGQSHGKLSPTGYFFDVDST